MQKILFCCNFQLKIDATHLERLLLTNASLSFLLRSASVFFRRTSSSSSFDPSSESKDLWLQVGQNLKKEFNIWFKRKGTSSKLTSHPREWPWARVWDKMRATRPRSRRTTKSIPDGRRVLNCITIILTIYSMNRLVSVNRGSLRVYVSMPERTHIPSCIPAKFWLVAHFLHAKGKLAQKTYHTFCKE